MEIPALTYSLSCQGLKFLAENHKKFPSFPCPNWDLHADDDYINISIFSDQLDHCQSSSIIYLHLCYGPMHLFTLNPLL